MDVVATLDAPKGQACVLMLNRDVEGEREIARMTFTLPPRSYTVAQLAVTT